MDISSENALELVHQLSEAIQNDVNLMDGKGMIIASTDPARIGRFHGAASWLISHGMSSLVVHDDDEFPGALRGLNLPVVQDGEIVGVVGMTGDAEALRRYGNIIKKMTEILLMENELSRQKRRRERTYARFVQKWIATPVSELSEDFVRWGLDVGIDVTLRRRVLVGMFPPTERGVTAPEDPALIERLDRLVDAFLAARKDGSVFAHIGQRLVCLVPVLDDRSLREVASGLQRHVWEQVNRHMVVGVDGFVPRPKKGACGKGIRAGFQRGEAAKHAGRTGGKAGNAVSESGTQHDVHELTRQADRAAAAALHSAGRPVLFYHEGGIELFVDTVAEGARREYHDRVFWGMADGAIEESCALIEAYFQENRSIAAIGQRLFMHKNTVQYRLDRLHEQTGYDLRRMQDALALYLAMLFRRSLGEGSQIDG